MAIRRISTKSPDPAAQDTANSPLFHALFTAVQTSLPEMELLSISDAESGEILKLDSYTLKQK